MFASNRWQAIIWTNADRIHWRIYAALGEMRSVKRARDIITTSDIRFDIDIIDYSDGDNGIVSDNITRTMY